MDTCSLPDFLPGGTICDGRRRYALQEMLCLRSACQGKPNGMQDYSKDGSLMQCSLLASSSDSFNWGQLAGALQDAMSSSGSGSDDPTPYSCCSPTNHSSTPSWSSPGKRSPDRRSRLQHSSSAQAGFNGVDAVLAGNSSPFRMILSPLKLFARTLPSRSYTNNSAVTNRISDGANDSSASADTNPTIQPLPKIHAPSVGAANKQQGQQRSAYLPTSPHPSPSPSSQMRGCFPPSPTTSPARAAASKALAGFVPASPSRAVPLPAELQDIILQLVSLLSCDPNTSAHAAQQLGILAFTSAANSGPIVAAGAVGPLANMLRGAATDEQQEGAAAALWGLARGCSAHQAIIIDNNAVPRLTRMLGSKSSALVYTALNALNELVGPPGANQQRQQVFADAGAVQMLCTCLKVQAEQGSIRTQQVAGEVLLALAVGNYENHAIIVKQRTVEALVEMLDPQGYPPEAPQAVAARLLLELVAGHHAGNTATVYAAGALPKLELLLQPNDGFNKYSEEGTAVGKVIGKLQSWQRQQKQSAMSAMIAKEVGLMHKLQQSQAGQVGQQLERVGSLPLTASRAVPPASVCSNGWDTRPSTSSSSLH